MIFFIDFLGLINHIWKNHIDSIFDKANIDHFYGRKAFANETYAYKINSAKVRRLRHHSKNVRSWHASIWWLLLFLNIIYFEVLSLSLNALTPLLFYFETSDSFECFKISLQSVILSVLVNVLAYLIFNKLFVKQRVQWDIFYFTLKNVFREVSFTVSYFEIHIILKTVVFIFRYWIYPDTKFNVFQNKIDSFLTTISYDPFCYLWSSIEVFRAS